MVSFQDTSDAQTRARSLRHRLHRSEVHVLAPAELGDAPPPAADADADAPKADAKAKSMFRTGFSLAKKGAKLAKKIALGATTLQPRLRDCESARTAVKNKMSTVYTKNVDGFSPMSQLIKQILITHWIGCVSVLREEIQLF